MHDVGDHFLIEHRNEDHVGKRADIDRDLVVQEQRQIERFRRLGRIDRQGQAVDVIGRRDNNAIVLRLNALVVGNMHHHVAWRRAEHRASPDAIAQIVVEIVVGAQLKQVELDAQRLCERLRDLDVDAEILAVFDPGIRLVIRIDGDAQRSSLAHGIERPRKNLCLSAKPNAERTDRQGTHSPS